MVSASSQHAIRALAHLSQVPAGESILERRRADVARVPANFLSKIMLTLGNAGLVEATRGQGGGYRLAKDARDITLMQVVDCLRGPAPGSAASCARSMSAAMTRAALPMPAGKR
ncbi:MAG: RrF2 family transcriptional regulator [Pirellulaceae bacterium]